MTALLPSASAPLAIGMGVLVLSCVLAIGLIPVLDAELRRATARRAAAETLLDARKGTGS